MKGWELHEYERTRKDGQLSTSLAVEVDFCDWGFSIAAYIIHFERLLHVEKTIEQWSVKQIIAKFMEIIASKLDFTCKER